MLTEPSLAAVPAADLNMATIRRALKKKLGEYERIIQELAPRATPNDDPVAWATTATSRRVVKRILDALDRVAVGTYGRCIRCGGAIIAARLEVLPYAETCIDCQNHVEQS